MGRPLGVEAKLSATTDKLMAFNISHDIKTSCSNFSEFIDDLKADFIRSTLLCDLSHVAEVTGKTSKTLLISSNICTLCHVSDSPLFELNLNLIKNLLVDNFHTSAPIWI